jgi:hypothetical protein
MCCVPSTGVQDNSPYVQSLFSRKQRVQAGRSSVHLRFRFLQSMQPLFERFVALGLSYWQVQRPRRHWLHAGLPSLHLIFFSRHLTHALPLDSFRVGDGSTIPDLVRGVVGERGSFPFLFFFILGLPVEISRFGSL